MRYELLLQARSRDERYDVEKVTQALAARGAVDDKWKLEPGEVELSPVREGENVVATAVRVPLSDRHELIRAAVIASAQVAEETGTRVIDPQLADTVAEKDTERVVAQFGRTAKYAGEMLGVPEAIAASFGPPPETGLKPATKVILGLLGVFLFIYLVIERIF